MARICMVAFAPYPEDTRIRREAEALVERGDTVDVICLREQAQEKVETFNGVRAIRLSTTKYRGSSAATYMLKYLQFFLVASLRLLVLHIKKHYQIIQVHTMPDFMVFVALLPKLLGAKVILDVHDLMPELYRSKYGLQPSHWLIRLITWVERSSIAFADRAIAVHEPHLNALCQHGNRADKFIILLNLPDPKIYANRPTAGSADDRRFRLLYHGTVARRHGLHVALQALAGVRNEITGLEFHIVGLGEELSHLAELARELNLADCVSIREDWLPPEELIPIILDADVGIVPILYDGFTKYMLPGKLVEYVTLGLPVICSRTETIQAYFDDSMVRYCRPGDADDLAQQILDLYRDPDKRKELAANANKFKQDHSWEQQRQRYYQLIDDLSRRGRSPGLG